MKMKMVVSIGGAGVIDSSNYTLELTSKHDMGGVEDTRAFTQVEERQREGTGGGVPCASATTAP